MPTPRSQLISLEDTPWYTVCSRCVRRAHLCGRDRRTGINHEHRRQWIEDRILQAAEAFAIDVAAYAVMHNHYHLTVRIDLERAKSWTDEQVIERWQRLFLGRDHTRRYLDNPSSLSPQEHERVEADVALWRTRLASLSWLMRAINEPIARRANAEDNCTGRFWEGRFYSQGLLDEHAVLASMVYNDLNPIRSGIADTPENSEHTSIKRRIDSHRKGQLPKQLIPLSATSGSTRAPTAPCSLPDYISLVDCSGRSLKEDKRGAIEETLPPILARLGIDADAWIALEFDFGRQSGRWIGSEAAIQRATLSVGKTRSRAPPLAISV